MTESSAAVPVLRMAALAALVAACGGDGGGSPTAPGAEAPAPSSSVPPPLPSGSVTVAQAAACREFDSLERLWNLRQLAEEDPEAREAWSAFFWGRVDREECGYFDAGDEMEWTHGERSMSLEPPAPAIQVVGTPWTGPAPRSRSERKTWWIAQGETSFGDAPPPTETGPTQPPRWRDVPAEPVVVSVDQVHTVTLRLSESVAVDVAMNVIGTAVEATWSSPRPGVVEVVVTGKAAGTATVELVARAEGYPPAATSFQVTVRPLQALRWLGVPAEPLVVRVGEERRVPLRLSEPVNGYPTKSGSIQNGNFFWFSLLEATPRRRDALVVSVNGTAAGKGTIWLRLEVAGYLPAEASLEVMVVASSATRH